MKKLPLAILGAALALASCSSDTAPTKQDIENMFGFAVTQNDCVPASGKPGFMCTFITEGQNWAITRRIIKTDGGWKAVAGN